MVICDLIVAFVSDIPAVLLLSRSLGNIRRPAVAADIDEQWVVPICVVLSQHKHLVGHQLVCLGGCDSIVVMLDVLCIILIVRVAGYIVQKYLLRLSHLLGLGPMEHVSDNAVQYAIE